MEITAWWGVVLLIGGWMLVFLVGFWAGERQERQK